MSLPTRQWVDDHNWKFLVMFLFCKSIINRCCVCECIHISCYDATLGASGVMRHENEGFHIGDARAFLGLASKFSPLGSMFDADVKNLTVRHQCENR